MTSPKTPSRAHARQLLLTVAGFGALGWAAWSLHPAAGWAAIGLSLLILEWLSRPDETSD